MMKEKSSVSIASYVNAVLTIPMQRKCILKGGDIVCNTRLGGYYFCCSLVDFSQGQLVPINLMHLCSVLIKMTVCSPLYIEKSEPRPPGGSEA